jgi:hypothetical protein
MYAAVKQDLLIREWWRECCDYERGDTVGGLGTNIPVQ